jgi:nitric oxide reductase NorQ protein
MARTKSAEAVLIEACLAAGTAHNYRMFQRTNEYQLYTDNNPGKDISQPFFNSVKNRWVRNRPGTTVTAAPAVGSAVAVDSSVPALPPAFTFEPATWTYDAEAIDMIPTVDKHFVITEENKALVDLVQKRSKGSNVNVRLVGPAGCGKTSFAMQYAANRKLPAMVMDCANVREPRDWFGYRKFGADTKDIVWHESMFIKMIETAGSVVVLDELNRVSPMVVNTLIPLLDHRRSTYLEEAGRRINVAEGVTFWAALNEGNQFTGTIALDEALSDRFGLVVECKFLESKTESHVLRQKTGLDLDSCKKLVEVANQVRAKAQSDSLDAFSKPISTRMLEEAAMAMSIGGTKTLLYTLLNHFSSDGGVTSQRDGLRKLLVGKFGEI